MPHEPQPLLERWFAHLRSEGHADPRAANPVIEDFLAFGRLSTLERLRAPLAAVAPSQIGPLRLACRELRRDKNRPSPTGGSRGPAPTLSIPEADLPEEWRRALADMRRVRARIDGGRHRGGGRTPPTSKGIRSAAYVLRALAAACITAGVPIALDRQAIRAWMEAARLRGCSRASIGMQLRVMRTALTWMGSDADLQGEIGALARVEAVESERRPKAKERRLRQLPLTLAEVMDVADGLSNEADAAPLASRDAVVLRLHAVALALAVCCPLRIGDLHRLRIGMEVVRDAGGWSLAIRTSKTGADYEQPEIWPEVERLLDVLVEMDAPGGDLWLGYDMRIGTYLFSMDGGRTGLSADWVSDVWARRTGHGAHIVRTLWHDELLVHGGERDVWLALALCGQRSERTARHYQTRAAKKEAGRRGRGMLAAARGAVERQMVR